MLGQVSAGLSDGNELAWMGNSASTSARTASAATEAYLPILEALESLLHVEGGETAARLLNLTRTFRELENVQRGHHREVEIRKDTAL